MLSPRLTSAYILQVENNAMEDGEGLGERDPALSLFSLDYSEECQDEEEEGPGDRDQYEGDKDDIRT